MSEKRVIPNALFFASVEEMIAEGRSVEITVKGFSMRPFLRNGRDVVTISPVGSEGLKRGMVVLFRHAGHHILHRIRTIDGDRLTIEGDGNYRIAESATRGDVVGYVSSVRLEGGGVFAYRSCRWHRRTFRSLTRKWLRSVAIGLKYKILG